MSVIELRDYCPSFHIITERGLEYETWDQSENTASPSDYRAITLIDTNRGRKPPLTPNSARCLVCSSSLQYTSYNIMHASRLFAKGVYLCLEQQSLHTNLLARPRLLPDLVPQRLKSLLIICIDAKFSYFYFPRFNNT